MEQTLPDALVRNLKKLSDSSFLRFVEKLSSWKVRDRYKNIPKEEVTGGDPDHVAGLIITYYKEAYGAELTLAVLEDIDEKTIREELQQDLIEVDIYRYGLGTALFTDRANFVDRHRSELIRGFTAVDLVLCYLWEDNLPEELIPLSDEETSQVKMKRLCDLIQQQSDNHKCSAYLALREYDYLLIQDLEHDNRIWTKKRLLPRSTRKHLIEEYRYDLVEVTHVDPVVDDLLDQKILTQEQSDQLRNRTSSRDIMKELLEISSSWERPEMDSFYLIVRKHNYPAIRQLERGWTEDHLVDIFRSDLIGRIKVIDPVLDDLLLDKLLSQETFDVLMRKTREEKMSELCERMRSSWLYPDKDLFYLILRKHNFSVIRDLEKSITWSERDKRVVKTDHEDRMDVLSDLARRMTVWLEQDTIGDDGDLMDMLSDLAQRVTIVDPVLDDLLDLHLLKKEVHEKVCNEPTAPQKMFDLCQIVRSWSELLKNFIIMSLRKYNAWQWRFMETSDRKVERVLLPHFIYIEGHLKSNTTESVMVLDPVIDDLREDSVLTQWQYQEIREGGNEDKMQCLSDIEECWSYSKKYMFYRSVHRYNKLYVSSILKDNGSEDVGHFMDRHRHQLIKHVKEIDPVIETLYANNLLHPQDYEHFRAESTPEGKIRLLNLLLRVWDFTMKDNFYISYWSYNYTVIRNLEKSDQMPKAPGKTGEHFMDRHKDVLTEKIQTVCPVISYLWNNRLLTTQQYSNLMQALSSEDMMRRLYDIMRDWDDEDKDEVLCIVYAFNYTVIEDLETLELSTLKYEGADIRAEDPSGTEEPKAADSLGDDKRSANSSKTGGVCGADIRAGDPPREEDPTTADSLDDGEKSVNSLTSGGACGKTSEGACGETSEGACGKTSEGACGETSEGAFGGTSEGACGADIRAEDPSGKEELKAADSLGGNSSERGSREFRTTESLERDRFLEEHRLDLINRVLMVDPVLDNLLDQGVLEQQQYDRLRRETSISRKMTALFDIVSDWAEHSKNLFYTSLYSYNYPIIDDLKKAEVKPTATEVVGSQSQPYRIGSQSQPYRIGYQSQPQFQSKSQFHYKRDIDLHNNRNAVSSFSYQRTFNETRESDKARKHFVDEHCWDLIRRIILVDPVLDDLLEENLLKEEEYNYLQGIPTSQKKMIELCDIVRAWDSWMKDQVYLALRQHNLPYIRVLEKSDLIMRQRWGSQFQKMALDLETGCSVGKHFLEKHKPELIDNVSTVIPVLEELREEGLLTPEQYDWVLHKETPQEKMTEICGITSNYDTTMKDKVYLSLRRHNYSFIRNLERVDRQTRYEHISDTVQAAESGSQGDAWFPGFIRFIITCVICMEMCHDPVTLSCVHNFCLYCIEKTWDNQDKDDISCPLCKQRFKKRPELKRNIILSQIEELCQSSKSSKKSDGFCTYCLHDNVPVAKSCLLCKALLCGDHLTVHSKDGEHVLLEPSTSLENRRCSIHNRVLEFYCAQDSLCICACCCITGEHKGHPVELAKDAMERKKIQLRDILENLTLKTAKIVKSIKVCRKAEQRNVSAAGDVVVQEIRDSLGAEVLGDMPEGQASASEIIKHLEARRDELLHDIESIEEQCYVTDPVLLL